MADNNINIGVKVTPTGVAELVKDTAQVAENLKQAAAASTRIPKATSAARAGMDARGQASADSNTARGIGGITGAAGRDFAAQAQGLGGLVHVYATFAANIFALSAAFTALSKAADLSNMIKGLDQLGASSGRSLSALAKQMTTVADGAISLRDALSATALATAGGLTNSAILRMTTVAKNAAAALGRDMPDALERISKGIVKNQPELLDELGIMTKLIPAQQDYARSVGKSVASLTEFEKKQAFANAVLKEGEAKFGSISLAANPYSKLLASLSNVSFSALDKLNTILAPIVKYLSESPTALVGVLTALGTVLLKQAIPAIGAYRQNLEKLSKDSREKVGRIYADQQALAAEADIKAQQAAQNAFRYSADTQKRINDLKSSVPATNNLSKGTKIDYAAIAKKDALDVTHEELKQLDARQKALAKKGTDNAKNESDFLKGHLAEIRAIRADHDKAGEVVADARQKADEGRFSTQTLLQSRFNKAQQAAQKDRILASTAETAATLGPLRAWQTLNKEVDGAKFGLVGSAVTKMRGAFSIATAAVVNFVGAFSGTLQVIGLVIAGFQLLSSWASTNAKESELFASNIDLVNEAIKTVGLTAEAISKKDPLEQLSVASAIATGTSLMGVADSITSIATSLDKVIAKRSAIDSLGDTFSSIWGGNDSAKASKAFVDALSSTFNAIDDPELKKKFGDKLSNLFGTAKIDEKSLGKAFSGLSDAEVSAKIKGISAAIQPMYKQIETTTSNLTAYKDTAGLATKASQEFIGSLTNNDSLFKFGVALTGLSTSLLKLSVEPKAAGTALLDLFKDTEKLALLTPELSSQLVTMRAGFLNNAQVAAEFNSGIVESQKEIAKLTEQINKLNAVKSSGKSRANGRVDQAIGNLEAQRLSLERGIKSRMEAASANTVDIGDISNLVNKAYVDLFVKGSDLINKSLGMAAAKAQLIIDKASAIGLTGREAIAEELRVTKADLSIQMELVSVGKEQILASARLTNAIEISNLREAAKKEAPGSEKATQIEKSLAILDIVGKALNGGSAALSSLIKEGYTQSKSNTGEVSNIQKAAIAVQGTSQGIATIDAKLLELSAQKRAAYIQAIYKTTIAIAAREAELLNREAAITKLSSDRISTLQTILGFQSATLLGNKQSLDAAELETKQRAEQLAIKAKIAALDVQLASKGLNPDLKKGLEEEKGKEQRNLSDLQRNQALVVYNKKLSDAFATQQALADQADRERQVRTAIRNTLVEQAQLQLDIDSAMLSSKVQLGKIDERSRINQEYALAASKAELDAATAMAAKADEIAKSEDARNAARTALRDTAPQGDPRDANEEAIAQAYVTALAELDKQEERQRQVDDAYVEGVKAKLNASKTILDITRQQNEQLLRQKELIDSVNTAADALSNAFGKTANAISAVAKILAKSSIDREGQLSRESELGSKLIAQQERERQIAEDSQSTERDNAAARDATNRAQRAYDQERLRSQMQNIDNIGAIAGAGKRAFGETSKQYKALMVIEKAAALISTGAAIAKLVAQSGWFGFAGAAALVGLLASYGITGGKSGSNAGGFEAGAQQSVQGTGQTFDAAGNKVDRAGGALGNSSAKAKSVDDSISMIEKHNFKNLEYSNKMLDALKAIKTNTDGLAVALLRAGITTPGQAEAGGFTLGTTGNTRGTTGGASNLLQGGLGSSGDAFLAAKFAGLFGNSGIGRGLSKVNDKIFGGKTNTTIEDSGVQISGLLNQIASDADGLAQRYANLKEVTSGGWFRSDKTNFTTVTENLTGSINTALEGIFTSLKDTVVAASDALGKDKGVTKSIIDSFQVAFKISAQGLSPEELANAINAEIGVTFNQLAEKIFPELTQFQQAGEEMGTTVVRLAREIQTTSLALESIGMTFTATGNLVDKVKITESLIALSGGLDKFTSQAEFFKNNFLTSAEQLAPIQKRLSEELQNLGYSGLDTREKFAKAVKALDLTTESGQQTYTALMNVSEAFAAVYPELRKVLSVEELAKSLAQQQIDIYTLEGRAADALLEQRKQELASMDERLVAGQLYIYALEDEAFLKGKLKTAYDTESAAIKNTITALKSSIKTLRDYKDSLSLSAQSNLNPQQKYQEAKAQAMQVAALATGILGADATDAQKQAKQDAINQLPAVSSTFLDASRIMFASSEMYNQDFAYIQDLLNATSSALDSQESMAEQQLALLDTQVGALINIKGAVDTTNEIMSRLVTAQDNTASVIQGARDAGLVANGISLDNNVKIESLFGNLIQEVVNLRTEVAALRADQAQQTADIITTNDQTTQQAAADTRKGFDDAIGQVNWDNTNKLAYD